MRRACAWGVQLPFPHLEGDITAELVDWLVLTTFDDHDGDGGGDDDFNQDDDVTIHQTN